jgi:mono/diheme cytochrome c family protein
VKTLSGALAVALIGAGVFIYSGVYDIAALDQHTKPVYWLLETAMQRSVHIRAREGETPDLSRAETIDKGFVHYRARCLQCHGGPGVAPDDAALGMTPVPANLIPTAQEWTAAEIHWVVKHGIKMTGMPAWKYRMSDDEIWQVVAFLKRRLPYLSAPEFRTMLNNAAPARGDDYRAVEESAVADKEAGRRAIDQYACATCHVIPGITGATRQVGPPLRGVASRTYIAGVLENTPRNMVRWIMQPQHIRPNTLMPGLRVREQDARDIAAYSRPLRQ